MIGEDSCGACRRRGGRKSGPWRRRGAGRAGCERGAARWRRATTSGAEGPAPTGATRMLEVGAGDLAGARTGTVSWCCTARSLGSGGFDGGQAAGAVPLALVETARPGRTVPPVPRFRRQPLELRPGRSKRALRGGRLIGVGASATRKGRAGGEPRLEGGSRFQPEQERAFSTGLDKSAELSAGVRGLDAIANAILLWSSVPNRGHPAASLQPHRARYRGG